jgi:hypothetical protein
MLVEPEAVTPTAATTVVVDDAALRALPSRRPADPPASAARIVWELVDVDRYEVMIAGRVTGYIDVVGALFVVLAGDRYPRAVEICQTLVWSTAVAALDAHRG